MFAAGYWVGIKLSVALVYRLVAGPWPRFSDESWIVMAAATVFSTMVGGQLRFRDKRRRSCRG